MSPRARAPFALVDGEPARLEVDWGTDASEPVVVRLDGVEVARHPLADEDFLAVDADGKRIILRRVKGGIEARIDQRVLEGSPTHPVQEARASIRGAAFFVALQPAYALGVWLHRGAARGHPSTDSEILAAAALVALGAVSLLLAVLIARRSAAAARTALPVIAVHGVLVVVAARHLGEPGAALAGIAMMEGLAFVACILAPWFMRVLEDHERTTAVGGPTLPVATRSHAPR